MDKRWISILIIIIIACGCGYLIIQSSDTVGNAIVDVNKSQVTIPSGFSGDSDLDSATFLDKSNSKSIYVKDLGKIDNALSNFKNFENELNNDKDIDIQSNDTVKIGDITVYTVYYINSTDSNSKLMSNSYLYSYEHTYLVKMKGFDNQDELNKNLEKIVKTIKPDYKKSQD